MVPYTVGDFIHKFLFEFVQSAYEDFPAAVVSNPYGQAIGVTVPEGQ
jgi:hypothetical protein